MAYFWQFADLKYAKLKYIVSAQEGIRKL